MICPNCKHETKSGVERCPECGNPLVDGRPWEKKSVLKTEKKSTEVSVQNDGDDVLRIRYQHREGGKFARYMTTQEREWGLQGEEVLRSGVGGFSRDPKKPEELKEGAVILSDKFLYFGDSDHAIRCGRYDVKIPIELVDYVTDAIYRGKKAILLCAKGGEEFVIFPVKIKGWIDSFRSVVDYRSDNSPRVFSVPESLVKSNIKLIFQLVGALMMFCIAFLWRSDTTMLILFIALGVGFLLLVAIDRYEKRS